MTDQSAELRDLRAALADALTRLARAEREIARPTEERQRRAPPARAGRGRPRDGPPILGEELSGVD